MDAQGRCRGRVGRVLCKAKFFQVLPVFQNELDLIVNWHTAGRQVITFMFMVNTMMNEDKRDKGQN